MKTEVSPPLRMVGEPNGSAYLPLEVDGVTVFPEPGWSVRAVDERTGTELWRRKDVGPPLVAWRDCYVTWAHGTSGIAVVNAMTGSIEVKPDIPFGLLEVRDGLITTRFNDDRTHVVCGDLVSGRAWRWSSDSVIIAGPVRSPMMTHFGTMSSQILALRTTDGSVAWSDDVSDLTHEESLETRAGWPAAGSPVVIDDTVIFYLTRDWTVGYCVRTGKRKWTHRMLGGTQTSTAHGGKYHALMNQDYVVLDPETGTEVSRATLDSAIPLTKRMFVGPPILVTDQHVWVVGQRGFIFAFTREGKYLWGFRPKGAAWGYNGAFRILGRRLYYTDSHRSFCFEEKPRRGSGAPSATRSSSLRKGKKS